MSKLTSLDEKLNRQTTIDTRTLGGDSDAASFQSIIDKDDACTSARATPEHPATELVLDLDNQPTVVLQQPTPTEERSYEHEYPESIGGQSVARYGCLLSTLPPLHECE